MNDEPCTGWKEFEQKFGVVCGEDIDAVLGNDETAVRDWAIGVLLTSLDRVRTYGSDANELLHLAIEILWQFSGCEGSASDEAAISRWLDAEHPRGRQWSKFVELVPGFIGSMNASWRSKAAKPSLKPISDEDVPF